ncbi:MAG: hypothetical protein U0900_09540 [Myxococcota bacterium]
MARTAKRLALLVAIAALVAATPRTGRAVEADPASDAALGRAARVAVDVFPIRFGGFLRTVVGGVFLVPATIFSGLAYPFQREPNVFRENADLYVAEPFAYTFRRPLGERFDDY